MNEEIKKIREYIKCPQFGSVDYGKWGALNLEQRKTFKRLCDYIESSDNYITNLQEKNQKLKEIVKINNDDEFIYSYEELQDKILKLQKEYNILSKKLWNEVDDRIELKQENQKLVNVIDELRKELQEAYKELQPNELINGRELISNILAELKGGSDESIH